MTNFNVNNFESFSSNEIEKTKDCVKFQLKIGEERPDWVWLDTDFERDLKEKSLPFYAGVYEGKRATLWVDNPQRYVFESEYLRSRPAPYGLFSCL